MEKPDKYKSFLWKYTHNEEHFASSCIAQNFTNLPSNMTM